ncbi:MAG: hypothetical protein ACI9NY_001878, partial [Kiritimatiellia bacterium]
MKHSALWQLSSALSLALIVILVSLWVQMNRYEVPPTQLINEQAADQYLKEDWQSSANPSNSPTEPLRKIKTGIFIQSLDFSSSSQVHVTGYIWQRYQHRIDDDIKPKLGEAGFILPEQVDSNEAKEVYRIQYENEELIGWYIDATLRQPFNYKNYPFDHKTIWVRMWAKKFSHNIVFTPDYSAYNSTGLNDIFGIEKNIVLGTWTRENTFFNYHLSSYDTNFGITEYVGQTGFPELHYNFVIKRKFENAFIVYLLPLLLVSMLLFAALLTVSKDTGLSNRHGFSTSGFIAATSTLFFVVMLAHIQLREEVAGATIVYIEYFYIIMY